PLAAADAEPLGALAAADGGAEQNRFLAKDCRLSHAVLAAMHPGEIAAGFAGFGIEGFEAVIADLQNEIPALEGESVRRTVAVQALAVGPGERTIEVV